MKNSMCSLEDMVKSFEIGEGNSLTALDTKITFAECLKDMMCMRTLRMVLGGVNISV